MMREINLIFDKPIDFLTYQLKQQFYDLSENELRLIAILHLRGINKEVKKEVVQHNVFKSMQSVENHLSKLRKKGIIDKNKVVLKYELTKSNTTSFIVNIKLSANKTDK